MDALGRVADKFLANGGQNLAGAAIPVSSEYSAGNDAEATQNADRLAPHQFWMPNMQQQTSDILDNAASQRCRRLCVLMQIRIVSFRINRLIVVVLALYFLALEITRHAVERNKDRRSPIEMCLRSCLQSMLTEQTRQSAFVMRGDLWR